MPKKFSSEFIEKAARLLKGENLNKDELSKYYQHRLNKKKYRRLKTSNVISNNDQWEIDLADNKDLARYNNQYRYWLVCVDVYSRYCWVELLKKKTAKNVGEKFEKILKKEGAPLKVQSDEGTEFQSIRKSLSKKYDFTMFNTFNREIKATHVERLIGTLKTMVRRVLTLTNENRYLDYLPVIINRYNNSPHSSLGKHTPYEIYRENKYEKKMKSVLLGKMLNPIVYTNSILKQGTQVRIARSKNNIFEKSSLRRWTNENFIIHKVYITDPVTYELIDLKGEKIKGVFYREELQKI